MTKLTSACVLRLYRVKLSDDSMAGNIVVAPTGTQLSILKRTKRSGVMRFLVQADVGGAAAYGWVNRNSVIPEVTRGASIGQ